MPEATVFKNHLKIFFTIANNKAKKKKKREEEKKGDTYQGFAKY